ncbi:UNKNOWN [Stylonychia lemnae]|uniref:Uncharacterized protein n=1 Tax=Stylonychia lemnae TaxID=5949 RepID=A0A078A7Z2_STYLE|nr:UNKNOWN [Stylonychia lemnae]|eukprot:CDW76881.1 UNKNOWN [Stylonychia lemnae]
MNKQRPFSAARTNENYPRSKPFIKQTQKPDAPTPKPKPEWNDCLAENPHKISRAEVLQRKLNAKSKNEQAAKEELQAKYEKLKQGKIPDEYKPFAQKGEKKFVANEAFITNKDLKRQYENRSYVSQTSLHQKQQKQRELEESRLQQEMEDEIKVKRETTEIKITYAQQSINQTHCQANNTAAARQILNQSQSQQDFSKDLEGLINADSRFNPTNFSIQFNNETQSQNNQAYLQRQQSQIVQSLPNTLFQNQALSQEVNQIFSYQPTVNNGYPQNNPTFSTYQTKPQQKEEQPEDFDYLDYRVNEQRLEKLRTQNMSLYSNYLSNEPKEQAYQAPMIQQIYGELEQKQTTLTKQPLDDLDSCFQNLNLLLGAGANKQQTQQQKDNQFETQSGYSITPIKYNQSIMDSPRSLLPNYQELFNFPPPPKFEDQLRIPIAQPTPQNQAQQLYQNIQQYSQQQFTKQPMQSLSAPHFQPIQFNNPVQSQQLQNQNYHCQQPQVQPYYQQNVVQDDDEEDQEFARMRDMLMNTQQEIDKIIQGTNSVQEIYQNSKQSLPSTMNGGQKPVQEQTFSSYNPMTQLYSGQVIGDDELKPRSYPFPQSLQQNHYTSNVSQNQSFQQAKPVPQFQSYKSNDSISLRANLAIMEYQIYKSLGVFQHKNNVREHYYCVKEIFDLYNTKELLEKLAARPDIDTVCAFDYLKMKQGALEGSGINYLDYHPEARGIKIPQL